MERRQREAEANRHNDYRNAEANKNDQYSGSGKYEPERRTEDAMREETRREMDKRQQEADRYRNAETGRSETDAKRGENGTGNRVDNSYKESIDFIAQNYNKIISVNADTASKIAKINSILEDRHLSDIEKECLFDLRTQLADKKMSCNVDKLKRQLKAGHLDEESARLAQDYINVFENTRKTIIKNGIFAYDDSAYLKFQLEVAGLPTNVKMLQTMMDKNAIPEESMKLVQSYIDASNGKIKRGVIEDGFFAASMAMLVTSLDKDATHIMSLANPLTCVRGFSSEGKSSTLVQMIFATDNVGFTVSDIDYTKIDADIEREIQELEATSVTKEAEEAAQEIYDENNEEMKNVFTPEFGFRTDADRRERQVSGVRTSFGNETDKVESRKATKIGSANDARIKGVRETDEDDENIPDNRV